ncbi:hypothetical protein BC832DRAFT_563501 [Gaertneriomyces semiglobifer]|nr:hypothetical protein BC832DRAFT_563501 [Gaertneriomyces semiglobifer]
MGQEQSYYTAAQRQSQFARPITEFLLMNRPTVTITEEETLVGLLTILRRGGVSCVPVIRQTGKEAVEDKAGRQGLVSEQRHDRPTVVTDGHASNNIERSTKTSSTGNGSATMNELPLIDILDIACFLTNAYHQLGTKLFSESLPSLLSISCSSIANFSSNNPTVYVAPSTPVSTVIFTLQTHSLARVVCYLNSDHQTPRLLTMTALLEAMLLNLDTLHPSPDTSLSSLGFSARPVKCLDGRMMVMDSLTRLVREGVTAMPVLSSGSSSSSSSSSADEKELLGIMTLRHLKSIHALNATDLFLPTRDFLVAHNATYSHLLATLDISLRECIRQMVVNVIHHVFFVEGRKVVGVLSVKDMVDYLSKEVV